MRMFMTCLICTLILVPAMPAQTNIRPILVHRYERGYSLHGLEDAAAYLVDQAGQAGSLGIRICSRESFPIALFTAAADPFLLTPI
jgi:hypothetical protein